MSAGDLTPGRRLADQELGGAFTESPQPGDYWRWTSGGVPLVASDEHRAAGNLTGGVWGICAPEGSIGTLRIHTVREHEDGTITVAPGDGSSNSILIGVPVGHGNGPGWHGYIDRGTFREV